MSRRTGTMELVSNVSFTLPFLPYTGGAQADGVDKSLVPLLLEKLTSAGKVDKSQIKYVTHRV